MSANLIGHFSNILFAGAYLVRGLLWLRVLSVAGSTLAAGFNYFAPAEPLWTGVGWAVFFVGLNLFAIRRMLASRRSARPRSAPPIGCLCAAKWLNAHRRAMRNA